MCGLNALRLGWLITCWGTLVVVVGEPATVVVVVEPAAVVVVVVVVVVVLVLLVVVLVTMLLGLYVMVELIANLTLSRIIHPVIDSIIIIDGAIATTEVWHDPVE
jgi:hypothetical protein